MPVTRNQSNAANSAKMNSATVDTSGPRENSERGETSADIEPSRQDSPENCSICLGPFNNKSFTSSCAHSFCFVCLKQWSKVKAECPLCKQPFTSIFHNIRSNDSYDIYELPPQNPPRQIDYINLYNLYNNNLPAFPPTHHYFSLPHPSLDADLTLSNFSRFQFRHRRYDRYLNPQHPVHGEHQYSYSSSSFNPSIHVSAASWPRGAEDFRLRVYRHHMGPPAVILGCENSTYRLTPAMVAASGHRLQRIMPWLTRELTILLRTHQNVRLAISMIQPLLTQVTIDSQYFSERVSPLIGQKARQFIQEFIAFTNSALNMQAFDRKAMYRRRALRFVFENPSSSSSDDDDVVEVTDISPEVQVSNVTAATSSNTGTHLQRAGWDSPTPGPSWESMDTHTAVLPMDNDRVSVSSESDDPVFRPDLDNSDSDSSGAGSDIVFVKYDKPWTERSPIKLSSDSDGDARNRKRKKSKHKKKRKELPEAPVKSSKKGKGRKSSKLRSKEKTKAKSKASSGEETTQGELSKALKKAHTSSSDRQKKKKHRRSKDISDDSYPRNRDRELVDRLFAEAVSQNTIFESGDTNMPCSSKCKNTAKSLDKDKHKRKKKKKSRGSASPSIIPSYKKHHCGHKKSVDKSNQESERRRHQHRRASRENASSEQSTSLERDMWNSRNQSLPPTNVGHSMASAFQASYLARTDTVQHIPLNVWVSTWPSLPVSHTFPPPASSSSFPSSSMSQPADLPGLSLGHSLSENNSSAMDSQTISSESESSSDSDTDSSPAKSISPLPKRIRTKQWLEANFSGVGQQSISNSLLQSAPTIPHVTRNWGIEKIIESTRPSSNAADVVSIASGDEDILVCSSTSSVRSDSDEVKVIESCEAPPNETSALPNEISRAASAARLTLADDSPQIQENRTEASSSYIQISTPPLTSTIFQPFKLHRKLALTKQSSNPFFTSAAENSDDDAVGTSDNEISAKIQPVDQDKIRSLEVTSTSIQDPVRNLTLASEFKVLTSSGNTESNLECGKTIPASMLDSSQNAVSNIHIPVLGSNSIQSTNLAEENIMPASFTLSSTTSEPAFGMLPPLPIPTNASVSSILPSALSYLPYTPLSVSASLTSILPQSMPFVLPQTQAPPALPLHFPFPPIQPLIPGSSSLFPSVFSTYSQTVATTSRKSLISGTDQNPAIPSSVKGSMFSEEVHGNLSATVTCGEETSVETVNSECADGGFASILPEDKDGSEPSFSEEIVNISAKMFTSEQPDKESSKGSSSTQAGSEEFKDNIANNFNDVSNTVDLWETASSTSKCENLFAENKTYNLPCMSVETTMNSGENSGTPHFSAHESHGEGIDNTNQSQYNEAENITT